MPAALCSLVVGVKPPMNARLILSIVLLGTLVTACRPVPEEPMVEVAPVPAAAPAAAQLETTDRDREKASEATNNYSFERREEFYLAVQQGMARVHEAINKLAVRLQNSDRVPQEERQNRLEALRRHADVVDNGLYRIDQVKEEEWERVKSTIDSAYREMQKALTEAEQWATNKITS